MLCFIQLSPLNSQLRLRKALRRNCWAHHTARGKIELFNMLCTFLTIHHEASSCMWITGVAPAALVFHFLQDECKECREIVSVSNACETNSEVQHRPTSLKNEDKLNGPKVHLKVWTGCKKCNCLLILCPEYVENAHPIMFPLSQQYLS